jgi:hypothetical protein
MLPYPNATLRGPRGMLVIVPAGPAAADLRRFQVFAPHGRAPAAGQQAADLLLQNAAQDSAAVQAIRHLYINQWGTIDGLSPDQLVARLRRDLTDGNFVAAFYIPAPDTVQYVVTTKAEISSLLQDPAGDPLKWSPAQRIAAMLRRIPAHLPGALQAQVAALFTPRAIALTALMLAALAVAQAYGVGEIVDLILVAAAWAAAGWGGLVALKDFIAAIIDAAGQTTLAPIEADAAQAADALVVLGITFITAVLLRAKDQEKVVSLETPPPEAPMVVRKPEAPKGYKEFPSTAAKTAVASRAAGFETQDVAALAALRQANPDSIRDNLEYGGLIYRDNATGKYGYTGPLKGTDQGANPWAAPNPPNTTAVGDYHTHGDYSTSDPTTGRAIRTSDPLQDDFNSDNFSRQDYQGIASDASTRPNYKGYLGTPSGTFKVFDPATDTDGVLGP